MNDIIITYEVPEDVNIDMVVNEIEYGTTFSIANHELIIPIRNRGNKWISYEYCENQLKFIIKTEFFDNGFFFEKFLTAFLYNIIEFGQLYLKDLDFGNIVFHDLDVVCENNAFNSFPVLGTIFKPYYHQSLEEKICFANKFIEYGGTLIKEDETYFVPKEKILRESKSIKHSIAPNGVYVPNVTSYISDFEFIKKLCDLDIKVMLINFLVTGFQPILTLKKQFPNIKLWGHRVGYEVLKQHISMNALGTLAILAGIDYLHIGTELDDEVIENQLKFIDKAKSINNNFLPIFSKLSFQSSHKLLTKFGNQSIHLFCGSFRDLNNGDFVWTNVKNTFDELRILKK